MMTYNRRLAVAAGACLLFIAVAVGAYVIAFSPAGRADAPYLEIEGISDEARDLGYTFREPPADFAPKLGEDAARKAGEGQFGGGVRVERIVLTHVKYLDRIDRPMWVLILDPTTVTVPDMSTTGEPRNLTLTSAWMLIDPDTGEFVSAEMR